KKSLEQRYPCDGREHGKSGVGRLKLAVDIRMKLEVPGPYVRALLIKQVRFDGHREVVGLKKVDHPLAIVHIRDLHFIVVKGVLIPRRWQRQIITRSAIWCKTIVRMV